MRKLTKDEALFYLDTLRGIALKRAQGNFTTVPTEVFLALLENSKREVRENKLQWNINDKDYKDLFGDDS